MNAGERVDIQIDAASDSQGISKLWLSVDGAEWHDGANAAIETELAGMNRDRQPVVSSVLGILK